MVSARTPTEDLCEIMELPREGANSHPWYMGVQYHPEFKSTPRTGHPLFTSFIKAALAHKAANAHSAAANNGALTGIARRRSMKLCGFDVGLDQPIFLIALAPV
ncbi:hypothetical protein LP419_29670 [Massilia sp. H-1]|nr:hypothetical protein LP419_29670 [Massilia sp. H-1]